jgi:hypothetical protein
MSTKLTLKPGEIVSDPGIYEVRKSNWRISLTKGQYVPLTPKLGEEWERVIDGNKLRRSPFPTRKPTASPNKELQGQRNKIDPKKLYKPKIPK